MCGILAVIGGTNNLELAKRQLQKMVHREPDEHNLIATKYNQILGHQRLAIIDLETGRQPIQGRNSSTYVIHNGEIYNHEQLRQELTKSHIRRTKSDSEIILHLYEERGEDFLHQLDGDFAFVLVDGPKILAGRDPIGIKPLFYGYDKNRTLWFASEFKALVDVCVNIQVFPPGHYFTRERGFVRYVKDAWMDKSFLPKDSSVPLRETLEQAIKKRLMSDVPLGILLSGGLDSSLIASIAAREMKKRGQTIKSFAIGINPESYDLIAAKKVAQHIGSEHHEVIFSLEDGIKALKESIYLLETYDVGPIRSGTPMYLLMKYIQSQGIKVILSGEGADEIFGGYMYFHDAPSAMDFQHECVKKLLFLHTVDLWRVDRAGMGTSVEIRVPFLDQEFLKTAMNLDPKFKMPHYGKRMEKHVLREAFDDEKFSYLPQEILWRQKEQFQDGVGYYWVDGLKAFAEETITNEEFELRATLFPYNTPIIKEAFLYRKIFEDKFQHSKVSTLIKMWNPTWQKNSESSGRFSPHHEQAKDVAG